jgi:hypothetical protein
MAGIYKRFAVDYKDADFSHEAACAMYLHESIGAPQPDQNNGYLLGKKWMDVTIAAWREDILSMGLFVSELIEDGYPEWFLNQIGILQITPKRSYCAWWIK